MFFVQAGFSALIFILGFFFIENDRAIGRREDDRRVDWFGAFLITGGLALLMFVLGDGTVAPRGWKTGCKPPQCLLMSVPLTDISPRCDRASNNICDNDSGLCWVGVLS